MMMLNNLNNSKNFDSNFDLESISIFSNKLYNYKLTVEKCDSNLKKNYISTLFHNKIITQVFSTK